MSRTITRTPQARQDLLDLADFIAQGSVDVVRVLHGARDIPAMFGEPSVDP